MLVAGNAKLIFRAVVVDDEARRDSGRLRDRPNAGAGYPVTSETLDGGVADTRLGRPVVGWDI